MNKTIIYIYLKEDICEGFQVVFTLETYGVKHILGIQYGFKGFVDKNYPPIKVPNNLSTC